jgi:uncharacterized protein (TIGR02118 family)
METPKTRLATTGEAPPTMAHNQASPHTDRLSQPCKETIMIKVSILYPNTPGSKFDMDYYRNKHMPMVQEKMAGACTHFTIDQGLAGGAPGAPATYVAMGQLFFESVESFQTAFAPHGKAIAADIPNYTDVAPVIQISQVMVG